MEESEGGILDIAKCNPETLENCDPVLVEIINSLNDSYIKYCDDEDNIFSIDCDEFYNTNIPLNDLAIKISKKLKEDNYHRTLDSKCQNEINIFKDKCMMEMSKENNKSGLYSWVKNKCDYNNRESNKSFCDKLNKEVTKENKLFYSITSERYTSLELTILIILITIVCFFIILIRKKSKSKNVSIKKIN